LLCNALVVRSNGEFLFITKQQTMALKSSHNECISCLARDIEREIFFVLTLFMLPYTHDIDI
jgi:hypothetical protein